LPCFQIGNSGKNWLLYVAMKPRQTALPPPLLLCACAFTGVAWVCIYSAMSNSMEYQKWALAPRINLTSTVVARGVEWTGTCRKDSDADIVKALPGIKFGQCPDSAAESKCQDIWYEAMSGTPSEPQAREGSATTTAADERYDPSSCTNTYQVWLKVRLQGPVPIHRCAYHLGLANLSAIMCSTADWRSGRSGGCRHSASLASALFNAFPVGSIASTWGIEGDDEACVIGFGDPSVAARRETGIGRLMGSIGTLFLVAAACLFCCAAYTTARPGYVGPAEFDNSRHKMDEEGPAE